MAIRYGPDIAHETALFGLVRRVNGVMYSMHDNVTQIAKFCGRHLHFFEDLNNAVCSTFIGAERSHLVMPGSS